MIPLPNVPVAAALLNNGLVLTWSAYDEFWLETDIGDRPSQTYTGLFDPQTGASVGGLETSTLADMFCPGTAVLPDGRIFVNGGTSSPRTSIYDPATNTWSAGPEMNIPRGYNADVLLSDGSVLTLGGSWSGPADEKIGEIWTASSGWTTRSGISAQPITAPDPLDLQDGYVNRGDNHAWLFMLSNGRIFHAGPSAEMHWIATSGPGAIVFAALRGSDDYSINGKAVMYDIGKILKTGGAASYDDAPASARTFAIDVSVAGQPPSVRETAPMAYPRVFANGVVLPDGKVLIVGGQTYASTFTDDGAVLVPELWDPVTESFSQMDPMQTPRTYHSTALLLPDGRVFVGGGGLCGDCSTNHENAEIFSPPYLFDANGNPAQRPTINWSPPSGQLGGTIWLAASAPDLTFALLRMSAVTHTVDNDQRRIPLTIQAQSGNTFLLPIPSDPGVVVPGYYMLFAVNSQGTPSVARIMWVG